MLLMMGRGVWWWFGRVSNAWEFVVGKRLRVIVEEAWLGFCDCAQDDGGVGWDDKEGVVAYCRSDGSGMRGFGLVFGALVVAQCLAGAGYGQAFNSVDSTHNLNYFNDRPMPTNAYRVLFVGDSLTYHGQTPNLWNYDSGMAASSPEKDFVHLVTKHLQEKLGTRPVEILINNGGNGMFDDVLNPLWRRETAKSAGGISWRSWPGSLQARL